MRVLTGHGIGKQLHEDPEVRNHESLIQEKALKEGMVLAIEPMVNEGTHRVYELMTTDLRNGRREAIRTL